MKKRILGFGIWCSVGIWGLGFGVSAHAAAITYQYHDRTFAIQPQRHWLRKEKITTFRGREVTVLNGREPANLPAGRHGVEREDRTVWDRQAIAKTLERVIGNALNREAGRVRIFRDAKGNIAFDGHGLNGRRLDAALAAEMTVRALEDHVYTIRLPVLETEPTVIVEDDDLRQQGIRELVTVGESDFTGSPPNRRHNITLGLSKFNGHLIGRGEEFSFNAVLGPVNERAGYREELTILGERTLPAYGGGLCQVSTTAYRGAWKAGFPITERRNHSFAVRYYAPPGTDATIYPPWTDLKFTNDTDGALLLQTFADGNNAVFLYYGTKPGNRTVELIGPFVWDRTEPPEGRIVETDEIPAGETRVVSSAVPGMKAMWYRSIANADGTESTEPFFSDYEARPHITEVGIQAPSPTPVERRGDDRWSQRSSSQSARSAR